MCDVLLMEVLECSCDFFEDPFAGILRKAVIGLLLDGVPKRDARKVLHDDIDVIVGLNNIDDLYNVRVGDHL